MEKLKIIFFTEPWNIVIEIGLFVLIIILIIFQNSFEKLR